MSLDPTTGAPAATIVRVTFKANGKLDDASITALTNAGVTRFRYMLGATAWTPATLSIVFAAGAWKDTDGNGSPATTATVTITGAIATVTQHTYGSGVDINTLNGRTYVDVTIPGVDGPERLHHRLGCGDDSRPRCSRLGGTGLAQRPLDPVTGARRHRPGCAQDPLLDHRVSSTRRTRPATTTW